MPTWYRVGNVNGALDETLALQQSTCHASHPVLSSARPEQHAGIRTDCGTIGVMIGRLHHVVLDCPQPATLAQFYSELLGQPITYSSADFVVVAANDASSGLAFQLAPDHRPPRWPDPAHPQQMHFDVMVDDVDTAGRQVLALGATRLSATGVFADPAGHPFCLIPRPPWAPSVGGSGDD
jgi:catechol 2,3-dioxygenase-like lactoylglutathione lyase family enzyme